jgi:inhibitor of KinA sporulation pathway (predicted exonuclease)
MRSLPNEFIIFDTEYTAWEGSRERNWSGEGEHKEVIQIGAIHVVDFVEKDSFLSYVQPTVNPKLSEYIMALTHIRQETIDTQGMSYEEAQMKFFAWCKDLPMYSFGPDGEILERNSELIHVSFPFRREMFFDVREVFQEQGIDTKNYMSSTIPHAFGITPPPAAHDALNDARSILLALAHIYT